ncbi:hypothetical protein [Pseudomonas sp. NFACC36]|uniref:hypothetical protein n=1 Tax=Pseudomonas sp. NFACC36 TaxID=1566197 RepID=UPI00091E7AED|nr:hypothetical protein [Pseudomonas sp. NFACC36]SFY05142.1 hypothetical protein SAMN03159309_03788 [Pseudomonas sp. NFACC36]
MSKHNKSLIAVAVCTLMLGASALLPADLSPIGASYAAGGGNGGGGGGGNGGGNGAGNGGGHAGGKGNGKSGDSSGHGFGLSSDHAGKATRTRDHGLSGNHTGTTRTDRAGKTHASVTSSVAQDRDTRGLTKASAISATTPGTHNTKGLTNATSSSIKNDR